MTPVPQPGSRLRPVGSAPEGPSTLDVRRRWPAVLLVLPFVASIAFAYLWFNTDIGRSGSRLRPVGSAEGPSTLDSRPPIWLTARTNLPGYTFAEEPVSDEVNKILGTTNILNGTFHRIADRSLEYADRKNSALA